MMIRVDTVIPSKGLPLSLVWQDTSGMMVYLTYPGIFLLILPQVAQPVFQMDQIRAAAAFLDQLQEPSPPRQDQPQWWHPGRMKAEPRYHPRTPRYSPPRKLARSRLNPNPRD